MNKQTRNIVFIFMFIVLGIMCAGYIMGFAPVYADKMTYCGEGLDIGDRMATDDHVWVTEYGHYICDICGVDGGLAPANDTIPFTDIKYSEHDVIIEKDGTIASVDGVCWHAEKYISHYLESTDDNYEYWIHSCYFCKKYKYTREHEWFVSEVRNDDFIHTVRLICVNCGHIKVIKEEHNMALITKARHDCTITEHWECSDCGYSTYCEYESHIGPFHRYTGDIVRCEECNALYNYITGEPYNEPA